VRLEFSLFLLPDEPEIDGIEWGDDMCAGDLRREFRNQANATYDRHALTMSRFSVSIAARAHRDQPALFPNLLPAWDMLNRGRLAEEVELFGGHVA
jgi:hypothetical protein